ncbi:MAG: SpoIIE family protein phosphatase [Evtepia gabavorous]
MRSAATELSTGLTPDLPRQEKLDGFLRSMNLSGGVVYYDKEGRLRVEVPAAEELKTRSARRELAEILGTPLREGRGGKQPNFVCPGRALSGHRRPGRGPQTGGAGERRHRHLVPAGGRDAVSPPLRRYGVRPGAKQESAQAAKLIERFLRAGMDPAEAVETVSSALSLRGEAGGSTTIDLLSVDLFTGRCCVHKQGAAPTYVRRGRQIKCAVGSSLPAGIVTGEQAKPDVHRFRGEQGDWIVMVTDGILCGREDIWIRDLMTAYQGDSPSDLAQRILQQSEEICQGEDDGTVLAVHLERGKEG